MIWRFLWFSELFDQRQEIRCIGLKVLRLHLGLLVVRVDHVPLQPGPVLVRLSAQITEERSLLGVHVEMYPHLALLSESFPANLAFVRPAPGVEEQMPVEGAELGKGLLTHLAEVGFLSGVYALVYY